MNIPFKEVSLAEVEEMLKDEPLAFDTETVGLYGKIRLAQFYQESWEHVLLVNYPNPFELTQVLDKAKVVMHNAHYDDTCIQAGTGTAYEIADYEDTFYLSRLHYYTKDQFSLDKVMIYVLGYDPYDQAGIDKKQMQKINWDIPILATNQKIYAAIDVYYLLDVYNEVKGYLDDTSYKLDMLSTHYALGFQVNGMPVLNGELQKVYTENLRFIEEANMPVNVNSWQQVRPYIGHNESDDLALATLALKGNERAAQVRDVRKTIKQNSFLNKFDTTDGRIYGKFLPSARSGRFTSKDQNLQQLPRKLKKVFGYETDAGRCLIYADFAQLEMRCIAAITGDAALLKILRDNEDLHEYSTKMIFGADWTPAQRQIGKTCNFILLYGASHKILRSELIVNAGILISEAEAAAIKKKWLNAFPSLAGWHQKGIADWRHGLPWKTPFGRRYTAKMMTDQLNIKNQGFGAEVAKLAMHYMEPRIKDNFEDVFMANFIHDSYIYDAPVVKDVYEGVANIVAESMQNAWYEASKTGMEIKVRDLPMPVDVFVGYNWGRIEEDYIHKLRIE